MSECLTNTCGIDNELLDMLACPVCRSRLLDDEGALRCGSDSCARQYRVESGIPVLLAPGMVEGDLALTQKKWEEAYGSRDCTIEATDRCLLDSDAFIRKNAKLGPGSVYFEAGCGLAKNAFLLAGCGITAVGLDICLGALKKAKEMFSEHGRKGFFVCGDMNRLPFRRNVFDAMYAGGSIEHFPDTFASVKELYRTIKPRGVLLATVPFISLSTLTYGQLTGNIPDVPFLKGICEFIHIRLLKGRFMMYGYEKSFTAAAACRFLSRAGFRKVRYGPYHTYWEIKFIKNAHLKNIVRSISRLRPFWPFIYVIGEKEP